MMAEARIQQMASVAAACAIHRITASASSSSSPSPSSSAAISKADVDIAVALCDSLADLPVNLKR